jgi:hypothetical protein
MKFVKQVVYQNTYQILFFLKIIKYLVCALTGYGLKWREVVASSPLQTTKIERLNMSEFIYPSLSLLGDVIITTTCMSEFICPSRSPFVPEFLILYAFIPSTFAQAPNKNNQKQIKDMLYIEIFQIASSIQFQFSNIFSYNTYAI